MSNAFQIVPGEAGPDQQASGVPKVVSAGTELMILFDGRVLVHNLTPQMRAMLEDVLGGETMAGVSLDADRAAETEQPMIRSI